MRPSQPMRHFWPLRNQRLFCSRLRCGTPAPLTVATEREPKLEVCSTIDTRYLPFVGRLFIGFPFIPWPLLLERRSLRKARDEAVPIRHLHLPYLLAVDCRLGINQ